MKPSLSLQYGLMAVEDVATHSNEGNIMAKTIAKEYNIPFEFLLKIVLCLAKAGILRSKRGVRGGFVMGRELDQITLFDIFKVFYSHAISQFHMPEPVKNVEFAVKMEQLCEDAIAEYNSVLQSITLAELVGSSKT